MFWLFFREFITNWKTTGAVAPSSPELARKMVEAAGVPGARRILELGPGTGAFTDLVRRAMPSGASYLGLEMNGRFVAALRNRFPDMQFEQTAAQEFDFGAYLNAGDQFDVIVSGLPWTAFPEPLQIAILDHVMPRLRPGGVLATFAYTAFHLLPSGRRFQGLLRARCSRVERTPTVWTNVLPAFVYSAVK